MFNPSRSETDSINPPSLRFEAENIFILANLNFFSFAKFLFYFSSNRFVNNIKSTEDYFQLRLSQKLLPHVYFIKTQEKNVIAKWREKKKQKICIN